MFGGLVAPRHAIIKITSLSHITNHVTFSHITYHIQKYSRIHINFVCQEHPILVVSMDSTTITRQDKLNKFLTIYCTWAGSSLYSERGIKLAQWLMWLLSQMTKNTNKFGSDLSPSLRKIYLDLSMMRYFLRFYGWPVAIDGVISDDGNQWKDTRISKISKVMAWSMVFYYPLEHAAAIKWNMPKYFQRIDANKFSAWSCRCWLVYILGDLISSYLKLHELEQKRIDMKHTENPGEMDEIEKSITINRLQVLRNVFYLPPCISWSRNDWATSPWLSENWVNGLSLAEAITNIYQSIYALVK